MLEDDLKQQLKAYLGHLRHPIRLSAALDDSEVATQMRELLGELAAASELVDFVELGPDDTSQGEVRRPSFAIHRPDEAPRVRFAGLPLGHEFTSLVLALLHVGGHPPKQDAAVLDQVRALDSALEFETYFSQSCQNCPDVVQALDLLATSNPKIRHTAIDGAAFPAEVEDRQIMAVPTIFLNGEPFGQGRMDLGEILAKVDTGAAAREAEAIAAREPYDVLIVGGGPAGAAAAIYAARKGIRTGIVTERFGGQVLDTLAIENFISVTETEGPKFAAALEAHVGAYDVDVIKNQRARALVPATADALAQVELESGATLSARAIILATGARWRDMNVPGEQEYRTRGVTYCPHCDGPLFKGKRVAVIGGGNSGIEAAIDLAGVVAHVTVLEFLDSLKADEVLQRKLASLANVEVITMAKTTEVLGDGNKVTGLRYEDRNTGESRELELEGVFVQIGLLPNTKWLEGSVELNRFGEIVIDDRGATSVPGVFAAGDATTVPYKQIIIATGDGAKAALGAFDHLIRAA
ncbi:alkyl hydroperoxide reductase subunit F [Pseudenhygromyxa sp. WMMC2535]|uniref:alkyl hydroperoxide reductase subunit F n=1 Tax=Pseudenhygromyxa sp. WMMC2535 TaxID=2712867 RepID=UPI0015566863|nr:alkyl hydroperoxide reductase subunit F [Pseudenhygromyxa sp. WMMC2535]NVB38965.1 alkyl hydroperoxide reductase subunit F [Pseudenhygromyxa sp. WMMC2535]